ncbi:MAG: ABC transporter ATP-binding protein [Planctomycetes bacterium]|nr:ABC transporter ATP-binding protein [Planctomycetota bacterium]
MPVPIAGSPVILAKDLEFHHQDGDFKLQVPELRLQAGETLALVGPSGCGKTTLLTLIAGTLQPIAGQLKVLGQDQIQASEAQRRDLRLRRIGMVFQEFCLLDYLSARDNVLLPLLLANQPIDESAKTKAMDLLCAVGLGSVAHRRPAALSMGERQRVAISRALLMDPTLVLADEPTGSLDFERGAEVLNLLIAACAERQASLILVTHDRTLMTKCDSVIDAQEFSAQQTSAPRDNGGAER